MNRAIYHGQPSFEHVDAFAGMGPLYNCLGFNTGDLV